MTNRQLAAAVRYGRRVTLYCPDLESDVVGYVMGFDEDNVLVAVPNGDGAIETPIRHRDYIAGIDVDRNTLMTQESLAVELEQMVVNFRKWIMNEYFPDHAQR